MTKQNAITYGLTSAQAEIKRAEYGLNEIKQGHKLSFIKLFFAQFSSFIIYILLFAVIFSYIAGEVVEGSVILAILLMNAIIGSVQEYSAQKSIEAIRNMSRTYTKVYRDGHRVVLDSIYLVPDDYIILESGDKVPADAYIIKASRLLTQEALLTGESVPITKNVYNPAYKGQPLQNPGMLFAGTTVVQGTAIACVRHIAMQTEMGKIAHLMNTSQETRTPLQKKLEKFGKIVSVIVIIIALIMLVELRLTNTTEYSTSWEMFLAFFLLAVSFAVAAVPEALPAVVTIALSVGVKRMVKKKVLVRTLTSVETLGSCDVICTDKTGTLTKNEMHVVKLWIPGQQPYDFPEHTDTKQKVTIPDIYTLLLETGMYCTNASIYREKGKEKASGDPTEVALLRSAQVAGIQKQYDLPTDEIPFDGERKMMSMLYGEKNNYTIYSKGAVDILINTCSHIQINNAIQPLTEEHKQKILEINTTYALQGLRVLGCAYKAISKETEFVEENLVFIGLQAMIDPPRPDVKYAIAETKKAGIKTIVITGDHKTTAKTIANGLGIEGEVLTSEDLSQMSDQELSNALNSNTTIFARIIPEHKQRIVRTLQQQGHTVAMIGDGVNDAPALKQADIGVAVENGSDIAKEASDFILLDNSFSNIVHAIHEGRGIYDNIQKSIRLLLTGNIGEVMIIFFAVLFGFNMPLTAIMILWINLISDGFPALAYSVDPYDPHIMTRQPLATNRPLLTQKQRLFIVMFGACAATIGLSLFAFANPYGHEQAQTLLFQFTVCFQLILAFIVRSSHTIGFFSNKLLLGTVIGTAIIQIVIMYTVLGNFLGVVALDQKHVQALFAACGLFAVIYIIYMLVQKYMLHKKVN